jgi:TrmH RNA methyltransferase
MAKRERMQQARRGQHAPLPVGEVILGVRACLAVIARRPEDVLRVLIARTPEGVGRHEIVQACGSRGVRCREASEEELEDLAGSSHHEGVGILARPRRWASAAELGGLLVNKGGTAIALDRVRNPYNVGAILRTAAFFGVDAALLGAPAPHPGLPPIAVRVAEGGAEHVVLARTTDLAATLGILKDKRVHVVGTDGRAPSSVFDFEFRRPTIVVLGHEREGLSERIRGHCEAAIRIPGTGAMESLNVGVAAGILVAEMVGRRTM